MAEPTSDAHRAELDAVYSERAKLVALLLRTGRAGCGWEIGLRKHEGPGAEEGFTHVVYLETPEGQLSWHIHDRDMALFEGLPEFPYEWDGHTTEQKYQRLERVVRTIDKLNRQLLEMHGG